MAFLQDLFHVLEAGELAGWVFFLKLAAVTVRRGRLERFKQERRKKLMEQLDTAHADRAYRITVVSIGQGDEFCLLFIALMLPVLESHLETYLDRGRAAVRIKDLRKPLWRDLHDHAGQLRGKRMRQSQEG